MIDIIFRFAILVYIVLAAIFKYETFGIKDGKVTSLFMASLICDCIMAFFVMFRGVP